ncbi:hypothetical protein llap_9303 [Limosa lapponica baueri]|uniref:Uncharacterized protein n=1 Tax=Limosa lapponica baueri TaxID=1758121 RepID=A0A2I0U2Y3_LIMLA|nr:hypothetical protein llap_9303 [Limosa lapponica baueri]
MRSEDEEEFVNLFLQHLPENPRPDSYVSFKVPSRKKKGTTLREVKREHFFDITLPHLIFPGFPPLVASSGPQKALYVAYIPAEALMGRQEPQAGYQWQYLDTAELPDGDSQD